MRFMHGAPSAATSSSISAELRAPPAQLPGRACAASDSAVALQQGGGGGALCFRYETEPR